MVDVSEGQGTWDMGKGRSKGRSSFDEDVCRNETANQFRWAWFETKQGKESFEKLESINSNGVVIYSNAPSLVSVAHKVHQKAKEKTIMASLVSLQPYKG